MGQKALGRTLVASTLWGRFGGTHGCWGSLRLDEDLDLLGRVLGCTFGCWDSRGVGGHWVPLVLGPYWLEDLWVHPWVPGTPWGWH